MYWSVPIIVWARFTIYSSYPMDFWFVPIIHWYRPIGYQYNWTIKNQPNQTKIDGSLSLNRGKPCNEIFLLNQVWAP